VCLPAVYLLLSFVLWGLKISQGKVHIQIAGEMRSETTFRSFDSVFTQHKIIFAPKLLESDDPSVKTSGSAMAACQ